MKALSVHAYPLISQQIDTAESSLTKGVRKGETIYKAIQIHPITKAVTYKNDNSDCMCNRIISGVHLTRLQMGLKSGLDLIMSHT